MHEINVKFSNIAKLSKEKLKEKMKDWNTRQWKQELETKTTLHIYNNFKEAIKEEEVYDNCEASIILYRAWANCLPLYDQRQHTGEDMTRRVCSQENMMETLEHFILECPALTEERNKATKLQQPYQEDRARIIGKFLFEKCNMEEKKFYTKCGKGEKLKELDL